METTKEDIDLLWGWLSTGLVEVKFTVLGVERTRYYTFLDPRRTLPAQSNGEGIEVIVVWDVEAKDFRCLHLQSITEFEYLG